MTTHDYDIEFVPRSETPEGRIERGEWELRDLNEYTTIRRIFDRLDRLGRMADTYSVWTSR